MSNMIFKMLTILFGWIKWLTSALWELITSGGTGTVIVSGIWLPVILILLAGLTAADFILYRRRWHPEWIRQSVKERSIPPLQNEKYDESATDIGFSAPAASLRPIQNDTPIRPIRQVYSFPNTEPEYPSEELTEEPRFDDVPDEWSVPQNPTVSNRIYVQENSEQNKSIPTAENSLSRFARKARGIMGFSTEEDLKKEQVISSVDPRLSFQKPVFPEDDNRQ